MSDREQPLDELRPAAFAIAYHYRYPDIAAIVGKSEDNVRGGSSPPPSEAIWPGSKRSWPTTWR